MITPISTTQFLATEAETLAVAAKIANVSKEGIILFLHGPLGAGKTTFARGFLRKCGYLNLLTRVNCKP